MVFPEPLGPRSDTNVPAGMSRFMALTATSPSYALLSWRSSTRAPLFAAVSADRSIRSGYRPVLCQLILANDWAAARKNQLAAIILAAAGKPAALLAERRDYGDGDVIR